MAHTTTLPKPTIHDPVTYWSAYHLGGEGRTRAKRGYVCYAVRGCPTNTAHSHAGVGATEREALLAATYWSNQAGFIRTVPASHAPDWAIEEAAEAARAREYVY